MYGRRHHCDLRKKNETILILISSKRYFNQYLTLVFLNFKEAM